MSFYPLMFGHAEIRIVRRDPRPTRLTWEQLDRRTRRALKERS